MAISPHCSRILEEPITNEICFDFRAIRARVMCEAWRIMEAEHVPFRTAVSRAWDKIKTECSAIGVHTYTHIR